MGKCQVCQPEGAPWPDTTLVSPHHNCWFSAIFKLFFFFKKCQSCAQHWWISKHDRGDQSVFFGGRKTAWEGLHDTALNHEQKHPWGLKGATGSLYRASPGPWGGGQAQPHAHLPPAWHAHPCTQLLSLGCMPTLTTAHTSTPRRKEPSLRSQAWRTQPVSEQGTPFKFFRCRQVKIEEWRRGPGWTPPLPARPSVLLVRGVATPGWGEGRTDR
jgi:hypothetical protein